MENLFSQKQFKNLAYALLALLIAFVAAKTVSELKGMSYIGAGVPSSDTITVSGTGEVVTAPDIATFTFAVEKEGASVPEAQKKSADGMNAILDYLKKAGIEDKDIKTESYNIYPRYDYVQTSMYGGGKQVLAAYVVSQNVTVKVRDLDKAGELLSGIGEYGATNISGLTFSVDDHVKVERQARDAAIADAREQAEILAKSLGVKIVRLVSFNESNYGYPTPIYYAKDMAYGMGGAANQSAPSIPTGENKITSNVSLTYEIR
ncbi:MAG TPA: SIMPL domain-containing protein [Candidatus Paceibacterota bacterium]|nr:SIMPL domain-containing protein [Candidatus Paceibacterota bacterium]